MGSAQGQSRTLTKLGYDLGTATILSFAPGHVRTTFGLSPSGIPNLGCTRTMPGLATTAVFRPQLAAAHDTCVRHVRRYRWPYCACAGEYLKLAVGRWRAAESAARRRARRYLHCLVNFPDMLISCVVIPSGGARGPRRYGKKMHSVYFGLYVKYLNGGWVL